MKARNDRQRMLRIIREYYGLTVDELAKEIDVSAKTIYRYETHQFKRMTGEILKCSKWYDEMWSELVRDVMKKGWR